MAEQLMIQCDPSEITDEELTELGERAREELERLLLLRPEYRSYQEEITGQLNAAGGTQNRLAVIGVMLEAKLFELKRELTALNRLVDGTIQH